MMNKKINKTDYIPNEEEAKREILLGIYGYILGEKMLEAFDEALKEVAKESFDDVFKVEHQKEETFLDRMIIEYDQLDNKLEKLDWFMAHEFDKLPKKERKLMKKQAETMAKYLYILSKRIDITKEKQKNETNRPSDTGSGN